MKPLIGLIPLVDAGRDSLWMLPGYMDGVRDAGGLHIMLPLTADGGELDQLAGQLDGVLFTGGHDVGPSVYGEAALEVCGATSPERDAMEAGLLRRVIALGLPALGICRGIQFINAYLGGTLWQDLPSQRPSATEHHQTPPYDRAVHTVVLLEDTPIKRLLNRETLPVNSYHHQAIRTLAPDLRPMALSEDGLIEAVWRPDHPFLWAVQWHPEFAWRTDPAARAIFKAFCAACAAYGEGRG